jgi:hypothetical protein
VDRLYGPLVFRLGTFCLKDSAVRVSETAPVGGICRVTTVSISITVLNGTRQVSLIVSSSCMSIGWLESASTIFVSVSAMSKSIDAELYVSPKDHFFVFNSKNIIVFHVVCSEGFLYHT